MQKNSNREQLTASYDWYRQMRETQPVFFDQNMQVWNLFRYDDVARVITEHATFSSEQNRFVPAEYRDVSPISSSIVRQDPPRHHKLRSLVSQAFTPRMVAQMEARIQEITSGLLDQVQDTGKMDVIRDLAYPLPVTVIAELLGVPAERREDFKQWSDAFISGDAEATEEDQQAGMQAQASMVAYFTQIFEERRTHPQDDLVSALLAAEVDGERLSNEELIGFCVLLLVAGNETTTNLIGNAILCLDENPGTLEHLRANRELVPGALEEALRYYSPVKLVPRWAVTETTIGDQRIEAGQLLFAWVPSAIVMRPSSPMPINSWNDIQEMSGTPGQRLALLVSKLVENRREQPELHLLLNQIFSDKAATKELREMVLGRMQMLQDMMRQLIVEGQASGEVAAGDPDQLITAFFACLVGLTRGAVYGSEQFHFPETAILLRILMPSAQQS